MGTGGLSVPLELRSSEGSGIQSGCTALSLVAPRKPLPCSLAAPRGRLRPIAAASFNGGRRSRVHKRCPGRPSHQCDWAVPGITRCHRAASPASLWLFLRRGRRQRHSSRHAAEMSTRAMTVSGLFWQQRLAPYHCADGMVHRQSSQERQVRKKCENSRAGLDVPSHD